MKKQAEKQNIGQTKQHPLIFYKVHALLHTLRTINGYEDQLCTLLEEIKRSGEVSETVHRELEQILEDIPSHEYVDDLKTLRNDLASAPIPATLGSDRG